MWSYQRHQFPNIFIVTFYPKDKYFSDFQCHCLPYYHKYLLACGEIKRLDKVGWTYLGSVFCGDCDTTAEAIKQLLHADSPKYPHVPSFLR